MDLDRDENAEHIVTMAGKIVAPVLIMWGEDDQVVYSLYEACINITTL